MSVLTEVRSPQRTRTRWWILAVLCLSLFMVVVDNTIVNVALPTLSEELSATTANLQWIVDAYTLVFSALLLAFGYFGDRTGRRRALQFGLVIFAITSGLAALSQTTEQLIGARALMGVGAAMIFSVIVGISIGILSAIKQCSIIDYIATFFAFFWLSIPGFFLSLLVIYIFAVRLDWFPVFGASSPGAAHPTLDRIHHLILPATVLGLEMAAALTRYTRASLVEVMRADYMRTARAKGLKDWTVIVAHGLKNALIPIITVIAFRLPYLISGAVVIETVYSIPGIGRLGMNAVLNRDYPVVQSGVLLIAASFVRSTTK